MDMKNKLHLNSLFLQIICTIILGTLCLVVTLSVLNIRHSEEVFVESFSESQEEIFHQIDLEFYQFYKDIEEISGSISRSSLVADYMTGGYEDPVEEFSAILSMKKLIGSTDLSEYTGVSLFIVGAGGKTYISNNSDRLSSEREKILHTEISREALHNPSLLVSSYRGKGFTEITSQEPAIIFARALKPIEREEPAGVVFITIQESDFKNMYDHFTSRTSDMLVFNKKGELLSSNDSRWFEEEAQKEALSVLHRMQKEGIFQLKSTQDGRQIRFQRHRLRNTSYEILGIIKPEVAFAERYNIGVILVATVMITAGVALGIFYFIRRQTRPLYALSEAMEMAGEGNLDSYVPVTGTEEVRQLSYTYNHMMDELKQYVEQIRSIEKEKRTAEIHALQMQINPHYMYNTLASIKWLAMQGDIMKTTAVIDAFILLLRNTISNTEEFVTVRQELENLQNYVLITQIRYGDHVQTEYYFSARCMEYKVPKLILQPFVENAFFHGFPEGRGGRIEVFARVQGQYLRFDIEDNGVGMTTEKLMHIRDKEMEKSRHFTGIGINNVDNRIKMLYGMDYGINIVSEEEGGTKITILLPLNTEEK